MLVHYNNAWQVFLSDNPQEHNIESRAYYCTLENKHYM